MNPDPRALWLAARRRSIGGSDAAILAGLTSWGSPLQLWRDKRGLLPDEPANERLKMGRLLEPLIARRTMEDVPGLEIITGPDQIATVLQDAHAPCSCEVYGEDVLCRSTRWPWLHATPDGLCVKDGRLLLWEAKTVEVWFRADWAAGVPEHVKLQTRHNAAVLGMDGGGLVSAWIGLGEAFLWAEIEPFAPHAAIAHASLMEEFWRQVQSDQEPLAQAGDPIDRPDAERCVQFPDDLLDQDAVYVRQAARAKEAISGMDSFRAVVKQTLGRLNATSLVLPDGSTWAWKKNGLRRSEA